MRPHSDDKPPNPQEEARQIDVTEMEKLMREGVVRFVRQRGLEGIQAVLEEEADILCGAAKHTHCAGARTAYRTRGTVTLNDVQMGLMRPRVRDANGEVRF